MRFPRLLFVTVLGVMVVIGTAAPAPAQSAVPLEVSIGFDDVGVNGTWTPVTVAFRPDRPVSGEVVVAVETMEGTWNYTRDVELAAGAPAALRMVVPPGRLRVSLVSDGEVIGRHQQRAGFVGPDFLIGVVGGDVDAAPSVNILPAEATAQWVSVAEEWLEIPRGVSSLDALVVPADLWPDMDDQMRQRLWTEVTIDGMTLVLTDPDDGSALPQPLDLDDPDPLTHVITGADGQPQAAVGAAGLGRVALVPGGAQQMGDGEVWAAVVGPRGVLNPINDWEAYERMSWAAQEVLAFNQGRPQAPGIPYLGIFLVVYVVAVGPLNALVLRRWGKPEWAWVSVPLVSLLFAAAPLVVTRPQTSQVPVATRTLTTWFEGGAQQRIGAAWPVPGTGEARARLGGDDWVGVPWGFQAAGSKVASSPGELAVDAQLRTGEITGLVASRTVPADSPPLQVTAAVDEQGQIAVEVRNEATVVVEDINLMVGNSLQRIGDLDPGEGGSQVVEGRLTAARTTPQFQAERRDDPEFAEQGFVGGPGVGAGLLPAAVRYGTPGLVWAIGTTAAADVDLIVDEAPVRQKGIGLVAVGAVISADVPATRLPPAAVLGQLINPATGAEPRMANEAMDNGVLRFRFPPTADDTRLAGSLFVMAGPQGVQLWDHTARTWRDVDRNFAGVLADPIMTASGETYVRIGGTVDGAGLGLTLPQDPALPEPMSAPGQNGMEMQIIEGPDGTFTEFAGPTPPMMTPAPIATLSPLNEPVVPTPPASPTPLVTPVPVTPVPVTPVPVTPVPVTPAPGPAGLPTERAAE